MKNASLIGLPVLLALFFAINIASGTLFTSSRLDLTEQRLWTLSDGTREVLGAIEERGEPVTLRLFYSEQLAKEEAPGLDRYAQRVTELLQEFVSAAGGALELIRIDPVPYSEDEELAVEFGMRGAPLGSGEMLYFGVAGTNSLDDQAVIPFMELPRENYLEYDLAKLIDGLAFPDRTRVGLLTTLPIDGTPGMPQDPRSGTPPWFILSQLEEAYELERIERGATELPADIDILLLVHPKELEPRLLFEIDQFVLGGGKLIAFLDPHCETDREGLNPQDQMSAFSANRTSDLGPLLESWGVELAGDVVAADRQHAHRVRYGQGGDVPYVVWLNLDEESVASDDPIVSELSRLHLATAGVLSATPDATTTFEPLVRTGTEAMKVDRIRVAMQPDPEGLLDSFASLDEELVLAARVSGPIATAYPDGPPEASTPEGEPAPPLAAPADGWRTEGEAQLVLIADADMLRDDWWVNIANFLGQRIAQPTANNADLLLNALDNLTGNSALMSLRSRQGFERPMTRVEDIRRRTEERFREEEQRLQAELEEAERRLTELQSKKEGAVSSLIITPEEREEIERFQEKRLETRKKLRDVKYEMNAEIEALGTRIKVLNFLVPALVALAGVALWAFRTYSKAKR